MKKAVGWSDSWELFIQDLERRLLDGATTEELARSFAGATVQWTGVLEKFDIDELAPGVDVALPAKIIKLPGGCEAYLDGLSLPIANSAVDDWRRLEVGSKVTFSAAFEEGPSPFPPVEIQTLTSGRSVVMVRLTDAVPMIG